MIFSAAAMFIHSLYDSVLWLGSSGSWTGFRKMKSTDLCSDLCDAFTCLQAELGLCMALPVCHHVVAVLVVR